MSQILSTAELQLNIQRCTDPIVRQQSEGVEHIELFDRGHSKRSNAASQRAVLALTAPCWRY